MYEQNKTEVGAGYFSKIVEIGVDIQYILTGKKLMLINCKKTELSI